MSGAPDDLAARLLRRLLEAAASRPDESGPLTVGEVYHDLIPYRGVRGELGVFELAAYEHALLRLLAGDVGPVRVADPAARAEFTAELGSPNPILGIYRDYASLEVMLGGNGEGRSSAPLPSAPPAPSSAPVGDDAPPAPRRSGTPADSQAAPAAAPPSMPRPELPGDRPAAPPDATRVALPTPPHLPPSPEATADCIDCGRSLPSIDGLRFCPHCGADQSQTPCGRCSTPLRADWNFCIRCGAPRSND